MCGIVQRHLRYFTEIQLWERMCQQIMYLRCAGHGPLEIGQMYGTLQMIGVGLEGKGQVHFSPIFVRPGTFPGKNPKLLSNEPSLCAKHCVTCFMYISSWKTLKTMVSTQFFLTHGKIEPREAKVICL